MITTVNLTYSVAGQTITPSQASPYLLASSTVKYVKAQFTLDDNWKSCQSVRAIWSGLNQHISTVLDSDGICYVPHELLAKQQKVYVNLVGSDSENGTLIDRITTYPHLAINVNATAYTDGSETVPITPSQFEQFVENVSQEADRAEDACDAAEGFAEDSKEWAEVSEEWAGKAEQSAAQAGYMFFYIDDDSTSQTYGHLIMDRTENVEVQFSLEDGYLFVEG